MRPSRPIRHLVTLSVLPLALAFALVGAGCDVPPEDGVDPAAEGIAEESGADGLRIGDRGDLGSSVVRAARLSRVKYWAPAIYQDVHPYRSPPWAYENDYITNFNFDGDYNGDNNDLGKLGWAKSAYVYYSSVETDTHWFLGYYFFHPRDRSHDGPNDLEGVILSIRRDGSQYGKLESWLTQSHGDTPPAINRDALAGCPVQSGPRGPVVHLPAVTYGRGGKPAVYVEPHGHGVKTCLQGDCGNNDGVIYAYEDGRVETPQHTPEGECGFGRQTFIATATCGYGLIPLDGSDAQGNTGFYVLRDRIGEGQVFQDHWTFRANGQKGEANPPWQWGHQQWLPDPAARFSSHVWRWLACDLDATASRAYTHQPYRF